jgi:hypothetical protein
VQGNYVVSLIEGDGIGPEISESVKDIFSAAKVRSSILAFCQLCRLAMLNLLVLDAYFLGVCRCHTYPERWQDRDP